VVAVDDDGGTWMGAARKTRPHQKNKRLKPLLERGETRHRPPTMRMKVNTLLLKGTWVGVERSALQLFVTPTE
jgi:hypothetical protein